MGHFYTRLYSLIFLFTFSNWAYAQVSFNPSDLVGANITNPTSLDFGPNEKLYVSQQDGTIWEFTVERDDAPAGSGAYSVIQSNAINVVKTGVPNHNDDGAVVSTKQRQVTGILTAGTPTNPILYVTSSDYRHGGQAAGNDTNLDTNSGVLSQLTLNGGVWEKVDLVRGLPRCEENHSTNGMDLFEKDGDTYLLIQQGGNANKGAPSNNFAGTQETYLSAALLVANLTQLEGMPTYTDPRTGTAYKYDLPTLDDPSRTNITNADSNFPYPAGHPMYNATIDLGDPFGGNNGMNQAFPEEGGPLQIFAPGFRNAYDVLVMPDGRIYTIDNGPNPSWGGVPIIRNADGSLKGTHPSVSYDPDAGDYITNEFNEVDSAGHGDLLHYVGTINDSFGTYYGGHTVPIRAFPSKAAVLSYEKQGGSWVETASLMWADGIQGISGYFNPSFSMADFPDDPRQGEYLADNSDPFKINILHEYPSSTNGMAVYTANNFSSEMAGEILGAPHDGTILRYKLNGTGDGVTDVDASSLTVGQTPLDVVAQGDTDIFPGTIWSVSYVGDFLKVFEPVDFGACPLPGEAAYDPLADYDDDGYTNEDEIDNGTQHCSAASVPADQDGDFISDLNDPDDDNDGILDAEDPFAWDPDNGLTTNLPIKYPFWANDPGTGFAGLGFTGWMLDPSGNTDYLTQFDQTKMAFGGAGGKATIEAVTSGTALGPNNTQDNGFQFGVNVDSNSDSFTILGGIDNPFSGVQPQNGQSYGIQIGTGDQDNYLKVALMDGTDPGDDIPGLEVVLETNGTPTSNIYDVPGLVSASSVLLYLSVNPASNTAQPYYSINGGASIQILGAPINLPNSFLDPNDDQGLAVGMISTTGGADSYLATWDYINITFDGAKNLTVDDNPFDFGTYQVAGGKSVKENFLFNQGTPLDGSITVSGITFSGTDAALFTYESPSLPLVIGPGVSSKIDVGITPDGVLGTRTANMEIVHSGDNSPLIVPVTAHLSDISPIVRVNSAGTEVSAGDGQIDWEDNSVAGQQVGGGYTVTAGVVYESNLVYANKHSSIPEYIDEDTFNALFKNERYDNLPEPSMDYAFPLANGLYQVNLFLGNSYSGTSAVGQRVFDVLIEDFLVGDNLDLIELFGHQSGGMLSFIMPVEDGELNLNFSHEVNNPLVNAIEILDVSNKEIPLGLVVLSDLGNTVGQQISFNVKTFGGEDAEPITFSMQGAPDGVSIDSQTGEVSGVLEASALNGGDNADGVHTVTVVAEQNGSMDATTQFTWTVSPFSSFRINTGGGLVVATDGESDWESNNSEGYLSTTTYEVNTGKITSFPLDFNNRHASIPDYIDETTFELLFATERYDLNSGPEMEFSIPIANGVYKVNLYMGNGFSGTSNAGERVFDVFMEDNLVKDDLDLILEFGNLKGGMLSFEVEVNDNNLNIAFGHEVENPTLHAIEILPSTGYSNFELYDITDQENMVGQNVVIATGSTGGDPNIPVTYTISGEPEGITINPTTGTITGSLPATSALQGPNGDGVYLVEVTAEKTAEPISTKSFTWTVLPFTSYRINAGGTAIAATDGEWYWESNEIEGAQTTSNFSVNTGFVYESELSFADKHSTIPDYIDQATFESIFATERYDVSGGQEMLYTIPLLNGGYTVNLYMGNSFEGTSNVGERLFDIVIEGEVVGDDVDLVALFGHQKGGMLSFETDLVDGELSILFVHVTDNPLINGIEVRPKESDFPPILVDNLDDQFNQVGDEVDLAVVATGGDTEANYTYSISGQPEGVDIEPTNGHIYGVIGLDALEGGINGDGKHTVTVVVNKPGSSPVNTVFNWDVGLLWTDLDESENYTARHECSVVQAGAHFLMMGGRENAKTVDIYDYNTDTWESLVDSAPFEFNHFQATEYQGLIWIIGALKDNFFPAESPAEHVWIFDPATWEWIQGPEIPLNRRRGSTGLVVHNDKFYVVGGNTNGHDGGYVAWFDEFDPVTGVWTPLADAPHARDHFHAGVIGDKLYAAGGRLSGGTGGTFKPVIPEVDVYDFTTNTWETLPAGSNLPTPRGGSSTAAFNDKLLVIGGEVDNEMVDGANYTGALDITEQYNPETGVWSRMAAMNHARHGTQAIVSGNGVFVMAGSPKLGGGDGGNQKNMEVFGENNPQGSPSVSSTLEAPTTVDVANGGERDIVLQAANGTVGIWVTSMEITGPNAADYSITSGELTGGLIGVDAMHQLTVALSGTGAGRTATLTVYYGDTESVDIQLTNDNVAPSVINPGDQYNNEGDVVSLPIVANDASGNLDYTASNLPPGLSIDGATGEITGTIQEAIPGSGAYVEENGLVIIEAENLEINDNWTIETDKTGYTGSGYLMNHEDHWNNPGEGLITQEIEITTTGVYRFQWYNTIGIIADHDQTKEHNDAWVKFLDADDFYGQKGTSIVYPKGSGKNPTAEGAGGDGWFKAYANSLNWNWKTATSDNDAHDIFVQFDSPGVYTMQISSRSNGHLIDRIALHHVDENYTTTQLYNALESQKDPGSAGASANSPYAVTVSVTDEGSPALDTEVDFVWHVGAGENRAPIITPVDDQEHETGESVALQVSAMDPDGDALEYEATGLPAGLSINTDSGAISGTIDAGAETGSPYTVEVTVNDDGAPVETATDSFIWTVTAPVVNEAPVAVADSDVSFGEAPLTVQFTGSNSTDDKDDITSYAWDFGDGTTSTDADPEHTFSAVGEYTVTLTVTDGDGLEGTAQLEIEAGEAPVAVAEADVQLGEAPLTVQFSGSNSTDDKDDITSYAWDFGDGTTSTEADPEHAYTTVGTYTVTLTVTDGDGLEGTAQLEIEAGEAPVAVAEADVQFGEAPLTVQFTGSNSTDDKDDIVSYAWDFGDGTTSTDADPTHTFSAVGKYTVTLTVTDGNGLEGTAQLDIEAGEAPVAIAEADVQFGEAPLTVQFMGSNSTDDKDDIVSYAWDFGDGATSTDADPTHTFSAVGEYMVTLTVTDSDGLEGTAQLEIEAGEAPVAVAEADTQFGEAPLTVEFTGSNSTDDKDDIVSYAWDFGDGTTSTDADPTHTFSAVGEYTVTLTVTDGDGLEGTAQLDIEAGEAPVAIAEADTQFGEAPLTVQFTGSGSTDDKDDIVSYAWDFDDGTTGDMADMAHTFTMAGSYTVILTVTDGEGLTDTDELTITVTDPVVNEAPMAVASSDVTEGDAPLEVNFMGSGSTDDNDDIASYSWDFGDGSTGAMADMAHTFTMAGSYTVILTVTDGEGLTDTDELTITVTDPAVNEAPMAVASSDVSEGDAPLEVNFMGSGSTDDNDDIASYSWDFGDGSTGAMADMAHTFTMAGSYTVILTVTDGEGLTDTDELTITVTDPVVNEAPMAVASSDVTEGDAPLEVNFMGSGSTDDNDDIASYSWDFGDGSMGAMADMAHTFTMAGSYTVILTVTDGEGLTDTDELTITVTDPVVNEAPVAIAESNIMEGEAPLEVFFTGSNSTDDNDDILSYAWDFGDGGNSTEADPTYTFDTPGEYTVTLTVTDGEGLTATSNVSITVQEGEEESLEGVLSPNPAVGDYTSIHIFNVGPDEEAMRIYVHDAKGRFVKTVEAQEAYQGYDETHSAHEYTLNVHDLHHGMYYIGVQLTSGKTVTMKLLVK